MPKIYNTRKQRYLQLLERLEKGPAFLSYGPMGDSDHDYPRAYHIWVRTWILPVLKDLIASDLKKEGR